MSKYHQGDEASVWEGRCHVEGCSAHVMISEVHVPTLQPAYYQHGFTFVTAIHGSSNTRNGYMHQATTRVDGMRYAIKWLDDLHAQEPKIDDAKLEAASE